MSDDDLGARFPSLMMAWRNLWRNGLRTALAALGIVIGVTAIAALGITGSALQYGATQQLGDLTTHVTVSPAQGVSGNTLSARQVREMEQVASNSTVIPVKSKRMNVSTRSAKFETDVNGVTDAKDLYTAQSGTIPDQLAAGVLLGNSTATRLNVAVGDPVVVGGKSYRVLAVLSTQTLPGFRGGTVVVPEKDVPQNGYSSVTVIAPSGDAASGVANAIKAHFNTRKQVVNARAQSSLTGRVNSLFSTINTALLGVGAISMLVAAVSILNVMLMSTIERRGEIGVLRAVGVRRAEVLRMILAEASLLGLVGGVVGVVLSTVVGLVIYSSLYGDATLLLTWANVQYLALGLAFGVLSSLLSGIYPAWKAANERPVDALRG